MCFTNLLVLLHGTLALKNNSYSKQNSQFTYCSSITNTTSYSFMYRSCCGGNITENYRCINQTPTHVNAIYKFHWEKIYRPNINHRQTCSAKKRDKDVHFWGLYHIHIFLFLTSSLIFVPCLEVLFFMNQYFLACIFKYCTSTRVFHLI